MSRFDVIDFNGYGAADILYWSVGAVVMQKMVAIESQASVATRKV